MNNFIADLTPWQYVNFFDIQVNNNYMILYYVNLKEKAAKEQAWDFFEKSNKCESVYNTREVTRGLRRL